MKKFLQLFFFLFLNLSVCLSIIAQSSRVETDIKNQKIESIPSSVIRNDQNIAEKKAAEVLKPTFSKTDSIKPTVKVTSSASLISKSASTKDKNEVESQILKDKAESAESSQRLSASSIDTPLYPDFKVEAVKEIPYENEFISKEKPSAKLEKLERVATDVQIENVTADAPAKITISPSKRKYLEGVLKDLEKELQQNPNTENIEMQVKKKEFEDLKKLLQQ